MLFYFGSKKGLLSHMKARHSMLHVGLLAIALCWLNGERAQAQSRSLPSHGKIKLDSYNHLLRDVHPASQAQSNYLQNRLFASGLKKTERLERQERLDVYDERQLINKLEEYQEVARRLSAGRPTSARSLATFWLLVSVFGNHAEVYDALSSGVPPMRHEDFTPTSHFIQIVKPDGELALPSLLLDGAKGLDASMFQLSWDSLVKDLHSTGRLSALKVATFRASVAEYRQQCAHAIQEDPSHSGRCDAKEYLASLRSLADALYRPQQYAQIQQFVRQGGYRFEGDSTLALFQHMLRNRVTPAQGSTPQLALSEVARPISRVLEQEIALHYERIDSLAAGEGHRPYAAEYRGNDVPMKATPSADISQWTAPGNAGI